MAGTGLTREQLEAVLLRISQTEHLGLKILDPSWNKPAAVLGHHQAGVSQLVLVKPHSPPALSTPQQNCVDGGREQITNDCRDQQDLETAWSLLH